MQVLFGWNSCSELIAAKSLRYEELWSSSYQSGIYAFVMWSTLTCSQGLDKNEIFPLLFHFYIPLCCIPTLNICAVTKSTMLVGKYNKTKKKTSRGYSLCVIGILYIQQQGDSCTRTELRTTKTTNESTLYIYRLCHLLNTSVLWYLFFKAKTHRWLFWQSIQITQCLICFMCCAGQYFTLSLC